jgi:uncharacterized protein
MDVTPLIKQGQNIIQSYGNGRIKISGSEFLSPVIVRAEATAQWCVGEYSELTIKDFEAFQDDDVVIIGCGENMAFLPKDLRSDLKAKNITVDVMDTGAACRTYNMLMSDGRNVVAALFPF